MMILPACARSTGRPPLRFVLGMAIAASSVIPAESVLAQHMRDAGQGRVPRSRWASAAPVVPPGWELDQYDAVDSGVADLNALAVSLRLIDGGLQLPSEFAEVYEVPNSDLLMRVHGALHAVFPASRYVATEQGEFPVVPNDTTFYIGSPPVGDEASRFRRGDDAIEPFIPASNMPSRGIRMQPRVETELMHAAPPRAVRLNRMARVPRPTMRNDPTGEPEFAAGPSMAQAIGSMGGDALPSPQNMADFESIPQLLEAARQATGRPSAREDIEALPATVLRPVSSAAPQESADPSVVTIATDEAYRAARVRELMLIAGAGDDVDRGER